jgi:hypothetical protein
MLARAIKGGFGSFHAAFSGHARFFLLLIFSSNSLLFLFDFSSISLRFLFDFSSISLRFLFYFSSVPFDFLSLFSFFSISLRLLFGFSLVSFLLTCYFSHFSIFYCFLLCHLSWLSYTGILLFVRTTKEQKDFVHTTHPERLHSPT